MKTDWLTITTDDIHRRESALSTLLEQMDIPELRRDTTSFRNLKWINRNLAVQNDDHPMFTTAAELTVWLLRWHHKQD